MRNLGGVYGTCKPYECFFDLMHLHLKSSQSKIQHIRLWIPVVSKWRAKTKNGYSRLFYPLKKTIDFRPLQPKRAIDTPGSPTSHGAHVHTHAMDSREASRGTVPPGMPLTASHGHLEARAFHTGRPTASVGGKNSQATQVASFSSINVPVWMYTSSFFLAHSVTHFCFNALSGLDEWAAYKPSTDRRLTYLWFRWVLLKRRRDGFSKIMPGRAKHLVA